MGLDAKVIKVVDRPPRGERFEDRKSRAISSAFLFSKGPPQGLSKHLGVSTLDDSQALSLKPKKSLLYV